MIGPSRLSQERGLPVCAHERNSFLAKVIANCYVTPEICYVLGC